MTIKGIQPNVTLAMVFQSKDQETDFFKAWDSHLDAIFRNENPNNLTKEEIAEIHWMPFQLSNWDWDKHVYKPTEREEPPRITWRISTNRESGFKHEIYDKERRGWIKIS